MQLELYCQWFGKWDEIHYVKAFILLPNRVSPGTKNRLMVQRKEVASKPLPASRTQEEKENEEISLVNALNPGHTGLVAGRPPQSLPPLLDTPETGTREPIALPLYDEGGVSP